MVKDISYTKLQLAVMEGQVDLSHLNIFEETEIEIISLGLKIHAGIIGTSHFVKIEKANEFCFTEIFACDVLEEKKLKPLCFLPIQKITTPVKIQNSFVDYQFFCKQKSYAQTAQKISTWAKKEQESKPLIFLEYHFNLAQKDDPSSRTMLVIHVTDEGLRINTIHEYQEEDTIILSESVLRFD